jgi:hypothetical protein
MTIKLLGIVCLSLAAPMLAGAQHPNAETPPPPSEPTGIAPASAESRPASGETQPGFVSEIVELSLRPKNLLSGRVDYVAPATWRTLDHQTGVGQPVEVLAFRVPEPVPSEGAAPSLAGQAVLRAEARDPAFDLEGKMKSLVSEHAEAEQIADVSPGPGWQVVLLKARSKEGPAKLVLEHLASGEDSILLTRVSCPLPDQPTEASATQFAAEITSLIDSLGVNGQRYDSMVLVYDHAKNAFNLMPAPAEPAAPEAAMDPAAATTMPPPSS